MLGADVTSLPGALLLIAFGAGVLAVAWRGYRIGELPAGTRGFHRWRLNGVDNSLAFHPFFAFHPCAGIALAVWGLLILLGMAAPLKLR